MNESIRIYDRLELNASLFSKRAKYLSIRTFRRTPCVFHRLCRPIALQLFELQGLEDEDIQK